MKFYTLEAAKEAFNFDIAQHSALFESVQSHVQVAVFDNKDHIVNAEQSISHLYLLLKGKAKVSVAHEDGNNSIVHFVKPNEMIGELTLIGIESRTKDVISIGTCLCLAVPMPIGESVLLKDEQFLLKLSQYIGTKFLDRTWFNVKHKHYELKYRLAAYILQCECEGIFNEKHTETAEYLAVSYRHLLHTVQFFRDEGLLVKLKKGYAIDREKLEELSSLLE